MKIRTLALRILGGLLLLAACALTFLWFFWLTPFKHLYSGDWSRNHSNYGHWIEAQKSIRRIGVTHDTGIEMGYWGGKEWTVWIMAHIKPGQDIGSCEASHLEDALADMTNQQLGSRSDTWLAWWTTNQNKSQLDWIRDGFARNGIELQHPITTNNIIALLKLVVPDTNSAAYTNIPFYARTALRFNALRWLRDSGFKPKEFYDRGFDDFGTGEFDLKSVPAEDRDKAARGLMAYAFWLGKHQYDPGKLPIDGNDQQDHWPNAMFLCRPFRWTLYSIIVAAMCGGWFLLRLSSQTKRP